jgi:sortase A
MTVEGARERLAGTHRGRSWWSRPGAALLIAAGGLLLTLALVRLSPYARTRIQTSSLLSSTIATPPRLMSAVPKSRSAPSASSGQAAELESIPPEAPDMGDATGAELAGVPLVPTPAAAPTSLVIPAISVDARVVPVSLQPFTADGQALAISRVPAEPVAGWHAGSAALGVPGNTVLSGHNTGHGEVFRDLYLLEAGDTIIAYSGATPYVHTVSELILVREQGQTLDVRRQNARYVETSADQRLTLVTCHPYGGLGYRLIVIARPGESRPGRHVHVAPR